MPDDQHPMGERMAAVEAEIRGFHRLFDRVDDRHQENTHRFDKIDAKIDGNASKSTTEHNELRDKVDVLQTTNDRQLGAQQAIMWMLGVGVVGLGALIGWGNGFWSHMWHFVVR